ncbi:MAG: TolC family protein [Myxococcales bacterium]|nr:TolC family protein [Myxococcales bacterium]
METEVSQSPLSLSDVLAQVARNSPVLLSKGQVTRAAKTRAAQVGAFEDPMVMVELWQAPTSLSRLPLMVTLKQPLPWLGTLKARSQVAHIDGQRAQLEESLQQRSLMLAAVRAYYQLALAHRQLAVQQQNQKLLQVIVSSVDVRYRVGRAELAELLDAQQAVHQQETLLYELQREQELAETELLSLLGESSRRSLGVPQTTPQLAQLPTLEELLEQALTHRPELVMAQLLRQQAQAKVTVARNEQAPDLALSASFMTVLRSDMENAFTAGVSSSIPSFSLIKRRAAEREAEAMQQAAAHEQSQLRASITAEVRAAFLRLSTVQRHLALHRDDLIPLSDRAVQAARAGYQSGKVGLSLLLSTTQRLIEQRLSYERYLAEYGLRRAELDLAVGKEVSP